MSALSNMANVDDSFSLLERMNERSFFHKQADVIGLKADNRTVRWMRDVQSGTTQLFAYAGSAIAFFPCLAIGVGAEILTFSRFTKIAILASAAAIGLLYYTLKSNEEQSKEKRPPASTEKSHTIINDSSIRINNFGNIFSTNTSLPPSHVHVPQSAADRADVGVGVEFQRVFHKSLAISALASGVVGASVGSVVSLVVVPPVSGTVNAFEYMVCGSNTAAA